MEVVSCQCGCRKSFTKYDDHNRVRRFSPGHHRRGTSQPLEWKQMMSRRMMGFRNHQWNPTRENVGRRKGNDFTKRQIKLLRKMSCDWCGSQDNLQLDHIFPCFAGGINADTNAQTLCCKCNNKKRDIDYRIYRKWDEFREHPLIKGNPEPSKSSDILEGATASI